MEPNQSQTQVSGKATAKDFFLNLGAIVALYTTVVSLLNLLFTVINKAYPQITSYYYSTGSQSSSFPVATLIIFFPIYVLLMWILEKGFVTEPEKRHVAVRRWLTYITLFITGLVLAGDLVYILYKFLDGQEMTVAFLLKALSVLVVSLGIFMYYISDIRDRLTKSKRRIWLGVVLLVIIASITWGFVVIGSPRTQQLLKYDMQKVSGLQNIDGQVQMYYQTKGTLPETISDIAAMAYYIDINDPQTATPYEYKKTGALEYQLCATFNTDSVYASELASNPKMQLNSEAMWTHSAGPYCFKRAVDARIATKPVR